ncbi:MAG: YihY/virulence factor BrkB family protein [Microscillaceae bacterium]|nr:YihY/virulence factor BrkB family protein [Microscillaceae bacterium]
MLKQIQEKITRSLRYKNLVLLLRKTKFRRGRVPLLKVMQVLFLKLTQTNIHQQASAIAFSFLLSLFPAILFLLSLIPFIAERLQMPDLLNQVLILLKDGGIPDGIYEFVEPTIADIIQNKSTGLLSFGFLFAIYAATNGVVELMNTFNINYAFSEKRSFWLKRLIAIGLAFLFAFLLIFAVVVLVVGQLVLAAMGNMIDEDILFYGFILLRYGVSFLVFYVGISYVYYIAPAKHNKWRFFSLGSTLASVLVIVNTYAFSFYLSNFATYNKLYGSIGTLIALMTWLYLLAWVLLLGFALDASIGEAKIAHEKELRHRYSMLDDIEAQENSEKKSGES